MITLDTSGLLALIDRNDTDHVACLNSVERDPGPYVVPVAILAEIGWFLERRFQSHVQSAFLQDLTEGAYALSWDRSDADRIARLANKYSDLPLGMADAAVIACAIRYGGRVLSVDHHFQVVARGEKNLRVLP